MLLRNAIDVPEGSQVAGDVDSALLEHCRRHNIVVVHHVASHIIRSAWPFII